MGFASLLVGFSIHSRHHLKEILVSKKIGKGCPLVFVGFTLDRIRRWSSGEAAFRNVEVVSLINSCGGDAEKGWEESA